ncbi:MAG TPA: hypothetical protein VF660_07740 [Actinomycetota bacterium]|jgi:glutamine synthetase
MARIPRDLRVFVTMHSDVEAVVQRCGIDTFDLILIDLDGNWNRGVFPSEDAAHDAARFLDVPVHDGWDERMVKRMNKRDHWSEPGGQRRAL